MNQPLLGRVAVVTGGARGIGAAIAHALAGAGASLALIDRDTKPLEERVEKLGADTLGATVNVTDQESVRAGFATIRQRFPRIDILVNSAGIAESAPFTKTDLGLWQKTLAVNLTGTFLCMSEAYPTMAKQDYGRIVNIASTAGLVGYPYVAAYCAAKHGVIGLTRALALEAAKTRVTVNAVCPGYTETDIVRAAIANIVAKTGSSEAEARAALEVHNPQARLIQPEEVANAVLWLCLPESGSITGQPIAVAGGEVM